MPWQHLGWTDSDGDGIANPVDTIPDTAFYTPPSSTSSNNPLINGNARDIPFSAAFPNRLFGPEFIDVTINDIEAVQFRIDGGSWSDALADDGSFDSAMEDFFFNPLFCENGSHLIEIRAINTVGNFSAILAHTINVNSSQSCEEMRLPVIVGNTGNTLVPPPPEPSPGPYPPPPPPPSYP